MGRKKEQAAKRPTLFIIRSAFLAEVGETEGRRGLILPLFTQGHDDQHDQSDDVGQGFLKFQVKAIRKGTGYVFMREEYFDISDQSLYLFLLLLNDGEHPIEYLISATTWDNDSSNIFVYHSYKGKKSKPEYGLNISAKNIPQLERFKLENMITAI